MLRNQIITGASLNDHTCICISSMFQTTAAILITGVLRKTSFSSSAFLNACMVLNVGFLLSMYLYTII